MDSGFLDELGAAYNHCLRWYTYSSPFDAYLLKNREEAREDAAVTRYRMPDRGLPDWFP